MAIKQCKIQQIVVNCIRSVNSNNQMQIAVKQRGFTKRREVSVKERNCSETKTSAAKRKETNANTTKYN